jgi:hypothetical protein
MDLLLQNLRTGETLALNPNRTLIGSAEYATVRTADAGPYLAALVVRYPGGWVVHGLSDDPAVTFNRGPLRVTERAVPQAGDLFVVRDERYRFMAPRRSPPPPAGPPPSCFAYVRDPDGTEECRAVDHDLLFGRLGVCHVRFADTRLSRLGAMLAAHGDGWFVHVLSKKPIAQNRRLVEEFAPLEDGDELQIGPLFVRVEIRAATTDAADPPARPAAPERDWPAPSATDDPSASGDTIDPFGPDPRIDLSALSAAGRNLDLWLGARHPTAAPQEGISGWLGAQRDRLRRFWYDTPETTTARSLRAAGKLREAFAVLDRAIRLRPDSPELLRELYRLYEAAGLNDLCYRPLRQIEKLADAQGRPDTWVLETLARVCERLGRERPAMFERAIRYWQRLETATGISRARERAEVSARRALRDGGFTKADDGR